jgi:uncharacterized protein DUF3592
MSPADRNGEKIVSERSVFRVLYIAWIVAAGMLWLSVAGRHSYPFYSQLRWICCAAFVFSALAFIYSAVDCYRSCKGDPSGVSAPVTFHLVIAALFTAGAIVFNPVISFHFRQRTWLLLDEVSLGVVIFFALICLVKLELPNTLTRALKLPEWLIVTGFVAYYTARDVVHVYGKYARATANTTAKVVEMEEEAIDSETGPSGVRYTGVYRFTVNGKMYYGRTDNYDVGDQLVVHYNPSNPDENRDPTEGVSRDVESFLGCVIIIAALGYWLKQIIVSDRSSPRNQAGSA